MVFADRLVPVRNAVFVRMVSLTPEEFDFGECEQKRSAVQRFRSAAETDFLKLEQIIRRTFAGKETGNAFFTGFPDNAGKYFPTPTIFVPYCFP